MKGKRRHSAMFIATVKRNETDGRVCESVKSVPVSNIREKDTLLCVNITGCFGRTVFIFNIIV
jgi:hypothetical protein